MFLHYLLNLPESDLTSKVFQAQILQPVKNDWALQVKQDLIEIGLSDTTFEEIKVMSKNAFKNLVKDRIRKLAFNTLMKEKVDKSKLKNLSYSELTIQPYLVTDKLSLPQKQLIYRIRVRDIDTPENYGRDVPCRLCFLARDEMSHILECVVIKVACPAV